MKNRFRDKAGIGLLWGFLALCGLLAAGPAIVAGAAGESGLVSAAEAGGSGAYPPFEGKFQGFVFLLLVFQAGYLVKRSRALREEKDGGFLLLQGGLSLLLLILSIRLAEYGENYGAVFGVGPDAGAPVEIGTLLFPYGIGVLTAGVWILLLRILWGQRRGGREETPE